MEQEKKITGRSRFKLLFEESSVLVISIVASIGTFIYFYTTDIILAYGDAASRLNIARKITDNLTPGIGQIGNIWLPFPHLLTMPLIWNNFLWHSGIAGAVISMISFVASAIFAYRIVYTWSKNHVAAFLASLVLLTNINMLYMQTTAMSETFFIMTVLGIMYFFTKWVFTDNDLFLFPLAAFVILTTLTRYEGYFVFGATFLVVLVNLIIKKNKRSSIEGKALLFITLASVGIALWTLYQAFIFKDPIYWLKVYTQRASLVSTEENRSVATAPGTSAQDNTPKAKRFDIPKGITRYASASAQMNGIVLAGFVALAFLVVLFQFRGFSKNQKTALLSVFIPLAVSGFIIMSVAGNFPLQIPQLSPEALLNRSNNLYAEYNIRYGLTLIPLFILVTGMAIAKSRVMTGLFVVFLAVQVSGLFIPNVYFIYSLPEYFTKKTTKKESVINNPAFQWMQKNYDGGLILISTIQHEPDMFFLGVNYKNYIHEGTQRYWLDSRRNPERYARWIYMYAPNVTSGRNEDSVTRNLKNNKSFTRYYDLVYKDKKYNIYKIKPEYEGQLSQKR